MLSCVSLASLPSKTSKVSFGWPYPFPTDSEVVGEKEMFKFFKQLNQTLDNLGTGMVEYSDSLAKRAKEHNHAIPEGENIINFSKAKLEKKLAEYGIAEEDMKKDSSMDNFFGIKYDDEP